MSAPPHPDPAPIAPQAPLEGECCESGCAEQCVWEHYAAARAEYEERMRQWLLRNPPPARFP